MDLPGYDAWKTADPDEGRCEICGTREGGDGWQPDRCDGECRRVWRDPDAENDAWSRRTGFIDIVFDGPPGPESGRFVEVEDHEGKSIKFGEWEHRPDGYWVLRMRPTALRAALGS